MMKSLTHIFTLGVGLAMGALAGRLVSPGQLGFLDDGEAAARQWLGLARDSMARPTTPLPQEAETAQDDTFDGFTRSFAEAQSAAQALGDSPTSEQIAEVLIEIDAWLFESADQPKAEALTDELMGDLRAVVGQEVAELHGRALRSATGEEGAQLLSQAGRALGRYPLSGDEEIMEEARRLATEHAETAARLQVIQRQRYNRWAADQIESALNGYHANGSFWSPKKENAALIDCASRNLGPVDPNLLEPAVLTLYEYAIELTKKSISEKEAVDLTKRLLDPSTGRRCLGEF